MVVHLMYLVDLESHSEIHDEVNEALLMADHIFQKIIFLFYRKISLVEMSW